MTTDTPQSTLQSVARRIGFLMDRESICDGRQRGRTNHRTVVQNSKELGREYWATRSSAHSLTCTAHSFACYALHALLARSAAFTHLLARSLCSLSRSYFICFFSLFWTIVRCLAGTKAWRELRRFTTIVIRRI